MVAVAAGCLGGVDADHVGGLELDLIERRIPPLGGQGRDRRPFTKVNRGRERVGVTSRGGQDRVDDQVPSGEAGRGELAMGSGDLGEGGSGHRIHELPDACGHDGLAAPSRTSGAPSLAASAVWSSGCSCDSRSALTRSR